MRRDFWESIYKYDSFSGGDAVTGWIAAFFPYLKDDTGSPTIKNMDVAEGGAALQRLLIGEWDTSKLFDGIEPQNFPSSGMSRAPFTWEYHWRRYQMELLGGFVGVSQDSKTFTVRPEIGWVVRHRAERL